MTDPSPTTDGRAPPMAVLIGGSAGSLDPLMATIARLPGNFAAAVVVVVHTPREGPSGLVGVLEGKARLPVREPVDKEPIEAGTVYVAPPGYHLLVEEGPCFGFSLDAPEHFSRPSIDVLFESAADVFQERAVGVVLSGANPDGARGLAAVRRCGGVALVQAPHEAASPEMPRAALAACSAAQPMAADEIAARILDVVESKTATGAQR